MAKEPSDLACKISTFNLHFPDDESCARFLFANGWTEGKNCKSCDGTELIATSDYRTYKCLICGMLNKIFAGTILFRVQKLRAWFAGIWFLSSGVLYSRKEFSELFDIAIDTAQRISNTVSMHLLEKMNGLPSLPSAAFSEIFGCRSVETPARKHPIFEQIDMENNEKPSSSIDRKEGLEFFQDPNLTENEKSVLSTLDFEKFWSIDDLLKATKMDYSDLMGVLVLLEIKGMVQCTPGQLYKIPKKEKIIIAACSETCKIVVEDFIQKVKSIWHRISRKNLQLHLALYWCATQKNAWNQNNLIVEILDKEPLSRISVRGYVSPLDVIIPLPA